MFLRLAVWVRGLPLITLLLFGFKGFPLPAFVGLGWYFSILSGLGYFGFPLLAGSDFDLLGFRASQGLPLITLLLLGFKGFPLPAFVGVGWYFGGRVSPITFWFYGLPLHHSFGI